MPSIDRRTFLKGASAAAAAGALGCETLSAIGGSKKPPNVLFIMSDQHNRRAMGCAGHPQIKTPNLDRLADEGVRFENAYCQTGQCCPSRVSIFTGQYAHTHGCRWNTVIENPHQPPTYVEILRDAGYATSSIGKHHMMIHPKHHGFDHLIDLPEYNEFMAAEGQPHSWWDGDFLPYWEKNFGLPAGATHADNDHHTAGYWANQAMEFMRGHREQPFCMQLSFYGPHMPYVASKEFMDLYDAETLALPPNFDDPRTEVPEQLTALRGHIADLSDDQLRDVLKCYMAYTSQIDYNVGRVLDELERLGIADNTIVVYTADHGDMMGEHRTFRKAVMNYEGTVGIPMMMRMPGVIPAGKTKNELVGLIDLMPTLLDAAGLKCPDTVQGRSMMALMQGRETQWRDVIFSEIGYPKPFATGVCRMARERDYKYIHHESGGEDFDELFNLTADPWELTNLAADPAHAETLARLKKEIEQWNATTPHAPLYPMSPWKERMEPGFFDEAAAKV